MKPDETLAEFAAVLATVETVKTKLEAFAVRHILSESLQRVAYLARRLDLGDVETDKRPALAEYSKQFVDMAERCRKMLAI